MLGRSSDEMVGYDWDEVLASGSTDVTPNFKVLPHDQDVVGDFSLSRPVAISTHRMGGVVIQSLQRPFSSLGAIDRIVYLFKNSPAQLAVSAVGAVTGFYLLIRSAVELAIPAAFYFSLNANAQESAVTNPIMFSSRDGFDWFIGALMAFVLIVSVIAQYVATSETKIKNANNLTQMVVGFAVGFLSGGAKPPSV